MRAALRPIADTWHQLLLLLSPFAVRRSGRDKRRAGRTAVLRFLARVQRRIPV